MEKEKRNKEGKRMVLLLSVLFILFSLTGCTGKDEGIQYGTVGNQKVWLSDLAYELWYTNDFYTDSIENYKENYDIDVSGGEDETENIRDEAYDNLVRTYILADRAIEEGETLSTDLQEDDCRRAEGILGEMDAEFISRYKITEKNLSRYLDYQSLAGIWFGKRIETLKEEAKKELGTSASENEIRLKAYDLFEEEYGKMLSDVNISLDDSLRNEVLSP